MSTLSHSGWAVFRNGDFRLFCAARFLSGLAYQMQAVAIGWFVYDLTRSALALGLVGLAGFLPAMLAALVTGHVADTYDRRLVAAISFAVQAAASFGLLAYALSGAQAAWPVYALVIVVGTARAFANPSLQALLPTLVSRDLFGSAIAWNSSLWQSSSVMGPAFGGLLYAAGPAVVFGGALCGLAGAFISLEYTPLWVEGMVAGRGWIALALTTFATWRPARVLLGAYLFGGVTMLQFHLQATGVQVASQLLSMLPYLATIVVLVLISRNPVWIRANMPASLGKPFYPGS